MDIKKIVLTVGASLTVLALLMCVLLIGPPKKEITIYDNTGNIVISSKDTADFKSNSNAAYLDVVLSEATKIIQEKESCNANTAKKKLFSEGYSIYTNLDSQMAEKINGIFAESYKELDVGVAITNLEGDLLAVASYSGSGKEENLSIKKQQPCSAFKPLAVYAPAIEGRTIVWSTLFEDSPYSKVANADGTLRDWPANANGTYSYKDITVCEAIEVSLNTVAVKCLSKFGVMNSIEFLENNFGINLEYEKERAKAHGENEVIGNLALGSTGSGCSTVDMAGYYQIFANGGSYVAPQSITKLCDATGTVIYQSEKEAKQVICQETSQIVNELLQKVVTSYQGTGRNAFCENIPVAGKTGTSEDNKDNWFVGVTPELSCAVWHSQSSKNQCPEIFADIIEKTEHKVKLFSTSKEVSQMIYCLNSGKLATKNCTAFGLGFFAKGTKVDYCDIHE